MKNVNIKISGVTAILMNQYPIEPIEGLDKKPVEEQLEVCTYRHPSTNELYIPGENIRKSIAGGAKYVKGKRGASMRPLMAAMLMIEPEYCILSNQKYEGDLKIVRNPTTGGRNPKWRPKIFPWSIEFTISFEEKLVSIKQMRECVDYGGNLSGILDFRPENGGQFGKYQVDSWKIAK